MLKDLTGEFPKLDYKTVKEVKEQPAEMQHLSPCSPRVDDGFGFEIPVIAFVPGACPALRRGKRQLTLFFKHKKSKLISLTQQFVLILLFLSRLPHEITDVAQFLPIRLQ